MPLLKPQLLLLLLWIGFTSFLQAGAEYKYSYIPKKVYQNQIFAITVLEIGSKNQNPHFSFDSNSSNKPIFKKPLMVKNGNDTFFTFYFKTYSRDFYLPELTISKGEKKHTIASANIPITTLKYREDFCAVLAADMKIKTSQASTYDENNNLITLSIEAFEANIENMHLNAVIEDGTENIKRNHAKVKAEYYVVVPATQKSIKFTYFNTIKGQYVFLQAPIVIRDYSVSTQSELNPKDDSFDKVKKMTFVGFAIFFFLLFLWKKDFFYLILVVLSVVTLLTFYSPKKEICIKQGAALYILPTYTSQISTKVDNDFTAALLGVRAEFNKIEYKNGIIGWVKNEDLCKN